MRSVDIGAVAAESLPDVSGMTFDNALEFAAKLLHRSKKKVQVLRFFILSKTSMMKRPYNSNQYMLV